MNFRWIMLVALALLNSVASGEERGDRGYSFFMAIGQQKLNYQETPKILPAKTEVDVTNPLLITGALYALNDSLLFSLDASTTFVADITTEKWKATAATFGNSPLTSSLLQENQFKLQLTETKLLAHYRLHEHWFAITGPAFRSQTFKRFDFQPGPDNATHIPANQVVEESASEILWQLGAALESEQLKNKEAHYSVRAYAAKPLWREIDNTLISSHTFDDTGGYDVAIEGRYSYALDSRMHVGVWGQYLYSERDAQKTCINYSGANSSACGVNRAQAELPESELKGVSYGIELLWKL